MHTYMYMCLQAQEGNTYFTELAERLEYGNYVHVCYVRAAGLGRWLGLSENMCI